MTHLHRVISQIHEARMNAGVTLNPSTPICVLEDVIQDLDMVLLMGVNPGFGGQKFIPHTLEKTFALREMIQQRNSPALIEIDGGVNLDNAKILYEAGADILVAGNAIFGAENPEEACARFCAI